MATERWSEGLERESINPMPASIRKSTPSCKAKEFIPAHKDSTLFM
jgi:hypothetical protein